MNPNALSEAIFALRSHVRMPMLYRHGDIHDSMDATILNGASDVGPLLADLVDVANAAYEIVCPLAPTTYRPTRKGH